jgi:hypothetical protein
MSEKIEFWDCSDQTETLHWEDKNQAIESYLDDLTHDDQPATLTVYGFARMSPNWKRLEINVLDDLIENLDEEYGSPDEATIQTAIMQQAAKEFVQKIAAEYQTWSCVVKTSEEINVMEWIKENRPHWLEPKPNRSHLQNADYGNEP